MKPNDVLKRSATPIRRTYKTKDDFLRWWREQDLLKKQAVEEQINSISQALMVWADDGGTVVGHNHGVKQLNMI